MSPLPGSSPELFPTQCGSHHSLNFSVWQCSLSLPITFSRWDCVCPFWLCLPRTQISSQGVKAGRGEPKESQARGERVLGEALWANNIISNWWSPGGVHKTSLNSPCMCFSGLRLRVKSLLQQYWLTKYELAGLGVQVFTWRHILIKLFAHKEVNSYHFVKHYFPFHKMVTGYLFASVEGYS